MMRNEYDANTALVERAAKRSMLSAAIRGLNRVHKDRKAALKRERVNNAALWRMLNTGV